MCVLCKLWKANYFLGKILSKNCKIQIDYKLKLDFKEVSEELFSKKYRLNQRLHTTGCYNGISHNAAVYQNGNSQVSDKN